MVAGGTLLFDGWEAATEGELVVAGVLMGTVVGGWDDLEGMTSGEGTGRLEVTDDDDVDDDGAVGRVSCWATGCDCNWGFCCDEIVVAA